MAQQTRCYRYDFRGHLGFPVTGTGRGSPFTFYSSGATTGSPITGGGYRLAFNAENDAQIASLYMGDVLSFDIDEIIKAWFIVKSVASIDSASSAAWGLTSARNDTIDTIAEAAIFRLVGSSSVVVETDDGTNNNDDVSTGLTLTSNWQRFEINFAERNTTLEPPSLSTGSPTNIGFYMGSTSGNSLGGLRRVASGTRFDMSNYTGGLQLFFQHQKSADTNTDTFDILECGVEVKLPDYS